MAGRAANSIAETKVAAECRHHWIIESPQGPTSKGVCKLCGTEREFANYIPDLRWRDDITALVEPTGFPGNGSDEGWD